MSNAKLVKFEEVTPTLLRVVYFDGHLSELISHLNLSIYGAYDGLDEMIFAFLTLPSGRTVTLGEYANSPRTGVDLYVDSKMDSIPSIIYESCQQVGISKSQVVWFRDKFQAEIDQLFAERGSIQEIEKLNKHQEVIYNPIACFQHSLRIYHREEFPEYWAMLQYNLGTAYYEAFKSGDQVQNLKLSLSCYYQSGEVYTQDKYPERWQISQETLKTIRTFFSSDKSVGSMSSGFSGEHLRVKSRKKVYETPALLALFESIRLLLEFLSGADSRVLQRPECQRDRSIYQSIGLNVALTGLLAFISFGYAMHTTFKVIPISIFLGLVWGFVIIMLDRFLLININKKNRFSWEHLGVTAMRFLLAMLIAIVISKPLELAVFGKEIRAEIVQSNLSKEIKMQQTISKLPESLEIDRLRIENQTLQSQNEKLNTNITGAFESLTREANGTSESNQRGIGLVFASKKQELSRLQKFRDNNVDQIQANTMKIQSFEKNRTVKIEAVQSTRLSADSILAQIQALNEMAKKDTSVAWSSLLISMIFVLVNISPLILKLLIYTVYDAVYHRLKNRELLWADCWEQHDSLMLKQQMEILIEKEKRINIWMGIEKDIGSISIE